MNKITFKKKVTKTKLKKFLKQIKDKDFLIHKDSNKSPWIYLDSKKFSFHFACEKGNVIGSLITFNSIYSRHLYFLYINEKYTLICKRICNSPHAHISVCAHN